MAVVVLAANGDASELLPATAIRGFIQNRSGFDIEVENAADPADGLVLGPGEMLDVGSTSAWVAAWTGHTLSGQTATVRVAFEIA
jgi:hypothetical protein